MHRSSHFVSLSTWSGNVCKHARFWGKISTLTANMENSPFRFVLASRLQSDWMLMLYFAHTHLTVTVTIGLLLIPKVFIQYCICSCQATLWGTWSFYFLKVPITMDKWSMGIWLMLQKLPLTFFPRKVSVCFFVKLLNIFNKM